MKIKKFLISTAFALIVFFILLSSTASAVSAQNASSASQYTYVICGDSGNGTIYVVDTEKVVTDAINIGKWPGGVVVSPDAAKVYVANVGNNDSGSNSTIYTIDTAANTISATMSGSSPSTIGQFIALISPKPLIPVANFSSNVTQGSAPFSVQFTDLSENATKWYWDFGDGANSTEQNPVHTYSSAGNYTVNLTVSNGKGADSKTATINVSEQTAPPVANFTYVIDSSHATVQFKDLSENATEWWWDFGDGLHSTERNPTHAYRIEGDYVIYFPSGESCTYVSDDELSRALCIYNYVPLGDLWVTLTAGNGNGADYISKQINISSSPEPETRSAHFLSFPVENNPLSIQFIDNSTPSPGIYKWDFGDGTTSTEQNPIHIYPSAGNYTVTLQVSGEWVGETSEVVSVQGSNASVANFSASPVCGKAPLTVKFTDKSTGSPVAWKWCFGDGTSSKDKNPVHTYCKAGEYNVTLIVNNTEGSNKVMKSECIRVLK